MARRPKSEALAAVHETASDLHSVGAISDERMREYDESCLEPEQATTKQLTFSVFKDAAKEWRWRLLAANGPTSGTLHKTRSPVLGQVAPAPRPRPDDAVPVTRRVCAGCRFLPHRITYPDHRRLV